MAYRNFFSGGRFNEFDLFTLFLAYQLHGHTYPFQLCLEMLHLKHQKSNLQPLL